jgi:hypothetical protein
MHGCDKDATHDVVLFQKRKYMRKFDTHGKVSQVPYYSRLTEKRVPLCERHAEAFLEFLDLLEGGKDEAVSD